MNVLLHLAAGTAIVASISHVKTTQPKNNALLIGAGFTLGVFSHGILDYVPHCYPINSKIDAIVGLLYLLTTFYWAKDTWKWIWLATLIGCLTPDVIDLSPAISNQKLGTHFPIFEKIFPWHFPEYSGSIYDGNCRVSTFNHIATLVFCAIVIYLNRNGLRAIFK